jgi:hypothetical protein
VEIDFSNAPIDKFRMYGGANGNKIGIIYQGENYMLKFPPKPTKNLEMSYTNSCICEYISCHIFQLLGITTQETLLGTYGDKVCVACKDFAVNGFEFKDFAYLKNTIILSEQSGYGTELSDILLTMKEQQIVSPDELEDFFWNMFAADTLLANFDRHNGNWGFLVNSTARVMLIAPAFDCGSCLYPQIQDNAMGSILESKKETEDRIYIYPTSAIHLSGRKINYAKFLATTEEPGCIKAIQTIGRRIDLEKINLLIDNTPYISDIHKQFLKTMIRARKEALFDPVLERLGTGKIQ